MADAETAVVLDAHLGGFPVCLLGIESRPVPRRGFPPTDGPDTYTAGTLFPQSSKKAARAINAASGNRPLVVLANLSGFDGSPESMRQPAAGVRRRDRPGDRELRRADRVLRDLALPRRRVRGVLQGAEPEHDGAGGGGLVRLGASAAPPRRRWCSPARSTSAPPPTRGCRSWRRGSPRPTRPSACSLRLELADLRVDGAGREDQRGGRRVRRRAQHPPRGRGRLGGRGDRGRATSGRGSSRRSSGGWARAERSRGTRVRALLPVQLAGGHTVTFGVGLGVDPADLRRAFEACGRLRPTTASRSSPSPSSGPVGDGHEWLPSRRRTTRRRRVGEATTS